MKQVLQSLRTGELEIVEVPEPVCLPGRVLVRNAFSFVSPGTERASREVAKSSLLQKAKERPDQVRKVFEKIRIEGLRTALEKVRTRLEEPMPLGYSSAGVVLEVGEGVKGIFPGDRVACAGAGYANHAEVVCVPQNLVAPIPEGVSFEDASAATLCAIALQSLRVGDIRLGELVGVIGLGMIGQVTLQLLKASGCSAIGIDIDPAMRAKAIEMGADWAVLRSEPVEEIVKSMTGGHGLDAAILCAATDSNDPIELAGEIVRRKGRVVVVGTLPMDIPRRVYYPKELEVRFSTSYGPGRYDPDYEERGHDYPYAYVRFTEKRNMETALSLIGEGKIRMGPLISERFHIDQAVEAYARIENPSGEKPLGILFDYKIEQAKPRTAIRNPPSPGASSEQIGAPGVGLIGAGRFAAGVLIPKLKTVPGVQLWRVATARGATANTAAKRFGFKHASCHAEEVYEDPAVGVVFIATRHRYHAEQLIAAVKAGKDVFVEKPLALDRKQLEKVVEGVSGSDRIILLGFNRRFAPMAKTAKDWFEPREWPLLMTARINAGRLDEDSWLLDPEEGGGRIVGEVCHVIDLFQYWTGSRVNRVAVEPARASKGVPKAEENLHISLGFEDGSAATLLYTSEGAGGLPKEAYEIHGGGRSAALHDWKRLDLYNGSRCRTVKSRTQDKGHGHAIGHFFDCVRKRKPPELSFSSCVRTTEVTFEIVERLRKGS